MKRLIGLAGVFPLTAFLIGLLALPLTVLASPDTERLGPDAILVITSLTPNNVTYIQDDPDSPDANWLVATGNGVNTDVRVSFPTPSGNPTVGADLQEFRSLVRQYDEGQTGTPLARIELWENGGLIRAGTDTGVPQGGIVLSFTWNANEISMADGSLVECKVVGTKAGGSPSARNTVDVGAVEWNVDYSIGAVIPTVTTQAATSIEETTSTGNGTITDTGGENCSERGVEWGTTGGGPYPNSHTDTGSFGTGVFAKDMSGHASGTTIYYRAKAYNSAGWGYGGEQSFVTKPNPPTSLQDTARTSSSVTVEWTAPAGGVDGYYLRYRTDQYPTSHTDGSEGYIGSETLHEVDGLSAGQVYYFKVWSYKTGSPNTNGVCDNPGASAEDTGHTLPGAPSILDAYNPSYSSIDLTWTKGPGGDKTMIRGKADSYPTSVTDGYEAYFDTDTSTIDSVLDSNTAYYYRAWACDTDSGYYSNGYSEDFETTLANGNPGEPPGAPLNFALIIDGNNIVGSWLKGEYADTTVIIRGESRYPESVADGLEVYNGTETVFTDEGLGVELNEYYYSAWSHNAAGYSTDYAEDNIGGVGMTLMAEAIFILGLSGLAMWRKNIILYTGSFLCLLLFGLSLIETSWTWGLGPLFLAAFMMYQSIRYWWRRRSY